MSVITSTLTYEILLQDEENDMFFALVQLCDLVSYK